MRRHRDQSSQSRHAASVFHGLLAILMAAVFSGSPAIAAEHEILHRPGSDPDPGSEDDNLDFGRAVDFDRNLLAVSSVPAVYVFERIDGALEHVATIDQPAQGYFDWPISIDNGVIAIAATRYDADGQPDAGIVNVYERGESNSDWHHAAAITAPVPVTGGRFGLRLSVSDGRILVGEWANHRGDQQADAYLYEQDSNGDWTLTRAFSGEDGGPLDVFDSAIDGDRIVLRGDDNDHDYGYEYTESGWLLTDTIETDATGMTALEDDVLLLSAPNEDVGENPTRDGVAYVYERDADGWVRNARLYEDQNPEGQFGIELDIEDGVLAIGGGNENPSVNVYMKNEVSEWTQIGEHVSPSVRHRVDAAISAHTLAIGESGAGDGLPGYVTLYDVGEWIAEAGSGDDSGDDGSDSGGSGDDDSGNDGSDDDADAGNSGEDQAAAGQDDDQGDGDNAEDDSAGSAEGGDSGGTGDESGGGEADTVDEPEGSSGGGAFAWVLLYAAPLFAVRLKRSCH